MPANRLTETYDASSDLGDFFPGERIGAPLYGRARRIRRRLGIAAILAISGGWAMWGDQNALPQWPSWAPSPSGMIATITDAFTAKPQVPSPPATQTAAAQPALPPLSSSETTAATDATAKLLPAALTPPASAIKGTDVQKAVPYQPPTAEKLDPFQERAAAAGLHPDLSRVVLTQLSQADYRNAGIAIQTALDKTPDDDAYIWPRQRKADLAQFRVHFASGAEADCRRYIVTISKDGWLTTALPMEKCGIKPIAAKRE